MYLVCTLINNGFYRTSQRRSPSDSHSLSEIFNHAVYHQQLSFFEWAVIIHRCAVFFSVVFISFCLFRFEISKSRLSLARNWAWNQFESFEREEKEDLLSCVWKRHHWKSINLYPWYNTCKITHTSPRSSSWAHQ